MSLPRATAECSLYTSTQQYRLVANRIRADGGVHLADSCMDDCMAECNVDVATCKVECRRQCEPRPALCRPGYQPCFGTFGHRTCCSETTTCCLYYDRVTSRELLGCCGAGQECCYPYGGCYDPSVQQCTPSGIWDCPTGRSQCGGTCCEVGEVCTLDGCTAPERVCQGRRCAPGEVCTPQGCCPPSRATPTGCCPAGHAICGERCCGPGESCKTTPFGTFCCPPGVCCETAPCPPGKYCCDGKICCGADTVCQPGQGGEEPRCVRH
jgi:hypothetical protein